MHAYSQSQRNYHPVNHDPHQQTSPKEGIPSKFIPFKFSPLIPKNWNLHTHTHRNVSYVRPLKTHTTSKQSTPTKSIKNSQTNRNSKHTNPQHSTSTAQAAPAPSC